MPKDLPISNGNLLLNFDADYRLRDIYFPHVGQENHSKGHPSRFGVWTNGHFSLPPSGAPPMENSEPRLLRLNGYPRRLLIIRPRAARRQSCPRRGTLPRNLPHFEGSQNPRQTPCEGDFMDQKCCTTIMSADPRKSLRPRESHPGVIPDDPGLSRIKTWVMRQAEGFLR